MKILYVFLEGDDDVRYFKSIIEPILELKYDKINYYPYSQKKKIKVNGYILTIDKVDNWDYMFISDIDLFTDIELKKNQLRSIYENLNPNKIVVVIKEIEAWYLAGIKDSYCKKNNISIKNDTNKIVKESFDNILNSSKIKGIARSSWMIEIIKNYDLQVAIEKNDSLKYFIDLIS